MRPLLTAFLLLGYWGAICLFPMPAEAQTQDRGLMERIDKPDLHRSFIAQKGAKFGTSAYQKTGEAYVKEFYYPKKFSSKEFLTGSYATKPCWMGDFLYSTRAAKTPSWWDAGKHFGTKTMATNAVYDAAKGYGADKAVPAKTASIRGRSQDKIDLQGAAAMAGPMGYEGTLAPLKSIDDVRMLLNKNK